MEVLKSIKAGDAKLQFVVVSGRRFRIRYEQRQHAVHSYEPRYYRAEVLTAENGWVLVASEEDIAFERAHFQDLQNHDENATEFFTAMRHHLQMLYS